ncbi:hypothetical protein DM02DRAFT_596200 [Periconia macrospinosa]|uniref:Zn(2)-C6 fungal-type domain-containing protein n=1 Tax=Periconia macrospinosa TaxID=97972 RepID=A0A2V1DK89_9PLEO|nr:hypothetical protein DM02DRAFT_596200 [Periconia macrospinosa]
MGVKGCWTCRERKVRCDLTLPACGNCARSRRVCKGYGMQLSWPRENDKRRSIVSYSTRRENNASHLEIIRFLNSSSWDVSLSEAIRTGMISADHLRTMRVPRPAYLSPTVMDSEQWQLIGFFNESKSLTLGPTDEEPLAEFILRVAFSSPSDPTNPVLQGVLALASLQVHGSSQSSRYKNRVVSSVIESMDWLDEQTLLQNLVGTMLLYHYELSHESGYKGKWVTYICAVKNIINTFPTFHKLLQREYAVFLDWIYYHEALAEFTIRHWKVPYEGCGYAPEARSLLTIQGSHTQGYASLNSIGCPTDVLQLVVHTCRQAIVTKKPDANDVRFVIENSLELERNIDREVGDYGPIHMQSETAIDRNTHICSIHRLACLIYINRAVHHVSETEFRHKRLVREGILLLDELVTCQNAWPLFIIGCEAVTEEQRLVIMDVFERSRQDKRRRSSHIHLIQYMVEAVWKQQDLDEENKIDYLTIIDAVVGGIPYVPPFA